MQCCLRRKVPMCAFCGAELDVHRAKAILYYGLIVRFCHEECQRKFLEQWKSDA